MFDLVRRPSSYRYSFLSLFSESLLILHFEIPEDTCRPFNTLGVTSTLGP